MKIIQPLLDKLDKFYIIIYIFLYIMIIKYRWFLKIIHFFLDGLDFMTFIANFQLILPLILLIAINLMSSLFFIYQAYWKN